MSKIDDLLYVNYLLKNSFANFMFYLGLFISLALSYRFFEGFNLIGVLIIISVFFFVKTNYLDWKGWPNFIKSWFFIMFVVIFVFWLVSSFGFKALIVFLLSFAIYRIWMGRDILMNSIRRIEKILFGKSLDKNNWRYNTPSFKKKEVEKGGKKRKS